MSGWQSSMFIMRVRTSPLRESGKQGEEQVGDGGRRRVEEREPERGQKREGRAIEERKLREGRD